MRNRERIRERYLKDALPARLMGLAADLSRVASSARRVTGAEAVAALLEESQTKIEWTATEAPDTVAEDLVNLQVLLALWRRAWPEAQHSPTQRSLLAVQAKLWSDQVMRYTEQHPPMEATMAQTALDLSPQQWQLYRTGQLIEASDAEQTRRLQRRQQAWRIARQAAQLLRDQYGAVRVIAFGSLVHDDRFTIWSDIDLAAWGVPPDRFYSAVAAVTGLSSTFRIDLVDPDSCRPALRQVLEREGVTL